MRQIYRCWAEVDLQALRENLAWIRQRVGPRVKLISVVKADAYGHGLKQIAALLMQSGTDIFGVANLAEARTIRRVGKGWPILMLGACLPDEVGEAVRDDVAPTISSLEEVERFSGVAARCGKTVPVHIKIDTGMGRLGVALADARALIRRARRLPGIRLEGLYTHYSAAEDDAAFSRTQRNKFSRALRSLAKEGIRIPLVHANNSAALLFEPKSVYNTVRPGLLIYGIVPPGRRRLYSPLKWQVRPALSWKCRISLVREIPRNTPLSYGHAFVARRNMRVATVTAGYGDGFSRAGGNRARVLVAGKACPVLGRITMDQMIVDVSAVSEARTGDEVVLIGRQGDAEITVSQVARWCGTVPWEVLTNIAYRVPRLYRGGTAA